MMDIIILVIILVFAIVGYYRGMVKSIITLCSSIVALAMSFVVYPLVNQILRLTVLYTLVYSGVFDKVKGADFGKGLQSQGKAITSNIDWLPKFLTEQIVNNNNNAMYKLLKVNTIQEYISTYITDMIMSMIAIVMTWFLIKVVLVWVLKAMGSIIEKLPIISQCNQLGGLIAGLLKGILTLSIIALIIPTFIAIPSLSQLGNVMQDSMILQILYEHNLVIWLYQYFMG